MTQNEMNELIPLRLEQIERDENITILYAAESGSRAWGFASLDSDFDVRFIYKRNLHEYLYLNEQRDVIEFPINETWDICGWDLKKTLRLLYKSNPTLYEWLGSPICYCDKGFAAKIKSLTREYFSRKSMLYHYYCMAWNNYKKHNDIIKAKQYFYILRPVLACLFIMQNDEPPPVLFESFCDSVLPESLRMSVNYLLDVKVNAPEDFKIAKLNDIDCFINESLQNIDKYLAQCPDNKPKNWDSLNKFFIRELES